MKKLFALILLAVLGAASCTKPAANSEASPNAKHYPFKGTIMSVDRANKKATIEHNAIPGFMEGMTMAFPIHADWAWDQIVPGAGINADLVVDNTAKEPFYLENVSITAPAAPGAETAEFPQIGKTVPDFSLTNQDGKKISLADFKGKAFAITFIYARCPLPDYCIRMSTNFSDTANQLKNDPELKDKVRLLSISFDPANDTPEKLRSYGIGYLGKNAKPDFSIWQLAVGNDAEVRKIADFFGLEYQVDPDNKTVINHSLRTAIMTPDGKVTKIFNGNDWTPADLIRELKSALAAK